MSARLRNIRRCAIEFHKLAEFLKIFMLSEFLSQYYREIFEYSTERGIVLRETISRMKYLNLFFFFFIEIPREENRNKRSILYRRYQCRVHFSTKDNYSLTKIYSLAWQLQFREKKSPRLENT